MRRHCRIQAKAHLGSPSRLLIRFAQRFLIEFPVLDAGCGVGRNAVALAQSGLTVVCADRNRQRLDELIKLAPTEMSNGALLPICVDLAPATWPFGPNCFSAVVCVHYLDVALFPFVHSSLVAGGRFYIETVGGQGQNHLELPLAGELHDLLSPRFCFELYKERPVGPVESNKRAVKLLAQKFK